MSDSEKWVTGLRFGDSAMSFYTESGYYIGDCELVEKTFQIVSEHNAHRELVEALKKAKTLLENISQHLPINKNPTLELVNKALSTIKDK